MNLSPEAKSALINVGVSRRGALVSMKATSMETAAELLKAGLMGVNWGLTDRGVTTRTKLINAALDAAF